MGKPVHYNGGGSIVHIWPTRSSQSRGVGTTKGLIQVEVENRGAFKPRTYVVSAVDAEKARGEKAKRKYKVGTKSPKKFGPLASKKTVAIDATANRQVTVQKGKKTYAVRVEVKRSRKGRD